MNQGQATEPDLFRNSVDQILDRAALDELGYEDKSDIWGNFSNWKFQKARRRELPNKDENWLDFYIREKGKPITSGEYHLHAYYFPKDGKIHWRVLTRGSRLCSKPSRCIKVSIQVKEQ